MKREILNPIKNVKNITKKQANLARIYSIMKKTHENLTENGLENLINNMVGTLIIEYHQRNKSYTIPDITDNPVLTKQTRRC